MAALTHAGERDLATALLRQPPVTRDPKIYLNDYGSALRDRAMALSLAAEEKLLPDHSLIEQAADLSRAVSGARWLSTQEEAWVLRGALALSGKGPLDVTIDGRKVTGRAPSRGRGAARPGPQRHGLQQGAGPVFLSVATTGVPSGVQPAEANGFRVRRSLFHLDGSPVDLADVHQNDEVVVVVEGTMDDGVERKVLLVDMLPAGLEPDTVGLSGSDDASTFSWLKDLSEPTFKAVRDDRYLAGFDLSGNDRAFKLAYVVRAVTPGTYARPGVQVEDMYAPSYHARGDAGTLEVKPARKG